VATIYTIGHGARPAAELVGLLAGAGVGVLADVRRHPGSRRHPQFGQAPLAATLGEAGIAYEWHGESLGGRRSRVAGSRHTALRTDAFAGYADHLDTPLARAAVDELILRSTIGVIAVMCAETVWWQCHRMLIADASTLRGAQVTHLLAAGRRQAHRLSPTVRADAAGWPVYDLADTLPGLG